MDQVEIYKGFNIRPFEREEGRWVAEIQKADGSKLILLCSRRGPPQVVHYINRLAEFERRDRIRKTGN
jgi:hypothetical protein